MAGRQRLDRLRREWEALAGMAHELEQRLQVAQGRLLKLEAPLSRGVAAPATTQPHKPGPQSSLSRKPSGTTRLYFNDTHCFKGTATLTAVKSVEEGMHCLELDQTLFHPQGGGQPADKGKISCAGRWDFEVEHVINRKEDNVIEHHGRFAGEGKSEAKPGDSVTLSIDEARRVLLARLHSAGHLLDSALANLQRTDLVPSKGYHFESGSYVEYIGAVQADEKDALIADVNVECSRLIASGAKVKVTMKPSDTPNGEPTRIVDVGGCVCPCGGTHVKNVAEIGDITITRIKKGKG